MIAVNCLVSIDGFTSFYQSLYVTKRVIGREQSIMGRIFFIFKVNTVEKVLRDLFQKVDEYYALLVSWLIEGIQPIQAQQLMLTGNIYNI